VLHAPRAYLLSQDVAKIARGASLLSRLPDRGEARVAVYAFEPEEWEIDVASRDRPALLARVSGVLADHGLDVLDAVVATWGDGGALESFRVRRSASEPPRPGPGPGPGQLEAAAPPDRARLEAAMVAAFDEPLSCAPNPDAEISFDDAGSPWYTLCEVRSPDRRGLLHTITVGIASANASVHSARLDTVEGLAVDRFELTDATGRKLDREMKEAVRNAVLGGVTPRRRRFGRLTRV
jgi:[protein-PII] uridylyltransferase